MSIKLRLFVICSFFSFCADRQTDRQSHGQTKAIPALFSIWHADTAWV